MATMKTMAMVKAMTTSVPRTTASSQTSSGTTRSSSSSPCTTSTPMTTFTPMIAWCTSCIELAHSAHCFTPDDDTAHLMAQVLSPFIVVHGHTHGAFSLTRSLPSSFTCPSCPSPSTSSFPELFLELDNPIVMASLRYSAAVESEDTLNSFTSPTNQSSGFPWYQCFGEEIKKQSNSKEGNTLQWQHTEHRVASPNGHLRQAAQYVRSSCGYD